MSIVGVALLSIVVLLFAGICVFFCRRYFARRTKASTADAAGTELGRRREQAAKVFNDLIDWAFSEPRRGINEWSDIVARSLTQQAAKNESPEDFKLRIEKIYNFETPPQLSNLSTHHSASEKSLVARADVLCRRFELNLSLTPERRTTTTDANVSSIEPQIVIFEFQSQVEGLLRSFDNVNVLTAKFPTEPKMRLEVKQRQKVNVDVVKLERLLRKTISATEFRFPIPSLDRYSAFSSPAALDGFELQRKTRTLSATSEPLENLLGRTTKKLLVRIVKANGLVASQEKDYGGSHQPFCVASIDSPAQSHVTSSVKNTTNPFFDEEFVFDLDQMTKKLTVEVHDKDRPEDDDFLGMAVLTVDDFSRNRHVLPLTGRGPLTFGALVVEVSIVDSSQVPSILATSHNVQYMAPPAPPIVLVSDADSLSPLSSMEAAARIQEDSSSMDLKMLRDSGSLPPKGDGKKKSLVGAIKRRLQRRKDDARGSQSVDRALGKKGSSPPSPQPQTEGLLYLTPTPSRASTNVHGDTDSERRSPSSSLRRNLGRLFHRSRREDDASQQPSMPSSGGHSPRSSVGPPSPRLLDRGPTPDPRQRTPSPNPSPSPSRLIPTDPENRLV